MRSFNKVVEGMLPLSKRAAAAISDLIGMVGMDEIKRAYEEGADANIRSFQSWNKVLAYGYLARNSHFVKSVVVREADRFFDGDVVKMFKSIDDSIFTEDVEIIDRFLKYGLCRRGYVAYLASLITIEVIAREFYDNEMSNFTLYGKADRKIKEADEQGSGVW